jgi:hypothetical protein
MHRWIVSRDSRGASPSLGRVISSSMHAASVNAIVSAGMTSVACLERSSLLLSSAIL